MEKFLTSFYYNFYRVTSEKALVSEPDAFVEEQPYYKNCSLPPPSKDSAVKLSYEK
jgi:hypothetical protein